MSGVEGGNTTGNSAAQSDKAPLYARVLRLSHIHPGPWLCFLFLEGSLAIAGVLVLADVVSLWALLVLPLGVAVAVKLNDVVTGALLPAGSVRGRSRATDEPTTAFTQTSETDDEGEKPDSDS